MQKKLTCGFASKSIPSRGVVCRFSSFFPFSQGVFSYLGFWSQPANPPRQPPAGHLLQLVLRSEATQVVHKVGLQGHMRGFGRLAKPLRELKRPRGQKMSKGSAKCNLFLLLLFLFLLRLLPLLMTSIRSFSSRGWLFSQQTALALPSPGSAGISNGWDCISLPGGSRFPKNQSNLKANR